MQARAKDWPACEVWSLDYLKEKYGNSICHASLDLPERGSIGAYNWEDYTRWMPLAEFVDTMRASEKACYMQQVPLWRLPGIETDLQFAELVDLGDSKKIYTNIFVGSSNTNSSLHYDLPDNFLLQVYGGKQVYLFPPGQRKYIPTFPDSLRMSPVDPYAPDLGRYPAYNHARGVVGVLGAGDVLFIPKTWWHQLRSINESISVNCWFGQEQSISYLVRVAAVGGLRHFLVPAKDFFVLGMLGGKYEQRLFGDEPTGRWLYGVLSDAVRRRFVRTKPATGSH